MALSTLSAFMQLSTNWTVGLNKTGAAATQNSQNEVKKLAFTLGTGAGACNQLYATVLTISASGSQTLTLTGTLTDLVGQTSITIARIKAIMIRLLSTTETAADGTTMGNACSSISVGNAGTHPAVLFLNAGTDIVKVYNGGFIASGVANATGFAIGAGASDQLLIANNDGSNSAIVEVVFFGADS